MDFIYLDNVATTNIDKRIIGGLMELLSNSFYNVDALYPPSLELKKLMEQSRSKVANLLNVKNQEIIFTSGATEANNIIIRGIVEANKNKKHLITSVVEHSSVSSIFDYYESIGYRVDRIKVDTQGNFDLAQLKKCLNADTLLVSIMSVNNELGTILPIKEISEIIRTNSNAYFHSDTTQALAKIDIDLSLLDAASFSAHKINGLKGSGFAYIKKHTKMLAIISGGQQEFSLRGGTSNAPYNIMLAKTLRIALENKEKYQQDIQKLSAYLKEELLKIHNVSLNSANSVDHIINIDLQDLTSQVALNALFKKRILLSGHSTCSSKKISYSYILRNMGFSLAKAQSSVRISLSHLTTKSEIDYFLVALKQIKEQYVI
ncbi:MAG: cysteine desulfurase family protein [Erysipelotrichaceae bacterium]